MLNRCYKNGKLERKLKELEAYLLNANSTY